MQDSMHMPANEPNRVLAMVLAALSPARGKGLLGHSGKACRCGDGGWGGGGGAAWANSGGVLARGGSSCTHPATQVATRGPPGPPRDHPRTRGRHPPRNPPHPPTPPTRAGSATSHARKAGCERGGAGGGVGGDCGWTCVGGVWVLKGWKAALQLAAGGVRQVAAGRGAGACPHAWQSHEASRRPCVAGTRNTRQGKPPGHSCARNHPPRWQPGRQGQPGQRTQPHPLHTTTHPPHPTPPAHTPHSNVTLCLSPCLR